MLAFFVPVALSSLVAGLRGPVLDAGLARTSEPVLALAGLAAVSSLIFILHTSSQVQQSVYLVYANGRESFRRVTLFSVYGGLAGSAVALVAAVPLVSDLILEQAMGATSEVTEYAPPVAAGALCPDSAADDRARVLSERAVAAPPGAADHVRHFWRDGGPDSGRIAVCADGADQRRLGGVAGAGGRDRGRRRDPGLFRPLRIAIPAISGSGERAPALDARPAPLRLAAAVVDAGDVGFDAAGDSRDIQARRRRRGGGRIPRRLGHRGAGVEPYPGRPPDGAGDVEVPGESSAGTNVFGHRRPGGWRPACCY